MCEDHVFPPAVKCRTALILHEEHSLPPRLWDATEYVLNKNVPKFTANSFPDVNFNTLLLDLQST